MPKVSKQTAGKIGLFSAIMVIFGAVVGIGIFFKNNTVFRLNDNNAVGILLSWIISIIIVLCMALSFAEISTCKMKDRNAGLGGWAQQFCGHKFGRYAKIGYSAVFYPVNTFAILFFLGEACLNCFADMGTKFSGIGGFTFGSGTVAYVFLVGAGFFALFMFLNYIASKGMKQFGNTVGLIKFIPIAMVVLLGIIFGVLYSKCGIWTGHVFDASHGKVDYENNPINAMGVISSVPAILFSYEGYLAIGNVAGDMEKPEKNVPLAVIIGVIMISVLYLAITIGCMTSGTGNVYQLMSVLNNKNEVLADVLKLVISVFILICLIGVINAMCFSGIRAFQALCDDNTFFKGKALANKKPGTHFAGTIYFSIFVGLWWLITIIPSSIANNYAGTDAIADGSSAVMVVYLYLIYGFTVLGGFMNRFTKKHYTAKIKVFPVTAVVAMLAALFVFTYCAFYQFLAQPISEIGTRVTNPYGFLPTDKILAKWSSPYDCGWGMFATTHIMFNVGGFKKTIEFLSYLEVVVWFWCMFALMVGTPFINDGLIKLFDKKYNKALLWEKPKASNLIDQ